MPGSRRASIVLPVPGGPASSRLCRPAAASSSARRARSWPRTSARSGCGRLERVRARRRQRVGLELAAQVRDGVGEVAERRSARCPASAASARGLGRAEDALEAHAPRALGDREDAADAAQPPVERELADRRVPVELVVRHLARRGEDGERDRQVVAGALLAQPGRREVDGDAAARELELGRRDPAADALPRLRARAVGQADDHERRDAVLDVGLDLDPPRLEADERMGDCACEHASTLRRNPSTACADSVSSFVQPQTSAALSSSALDLDVAGAREVRQCARARRAR